MCQVCYCRFLVYMCTECYCNDYQCGEHMICSTCKLEVYSNPPPISLPTYDDDR